MSDWFEDNAPGKTPNTFPTYKDQAPPVRDWFADNAPDKVADKNSWAPKEGQPGQPGITRQAPVALNPKFDPNAPSREETGGTSPRDALKNFGQAAGETAAGVVGAPAMTAAAALTPEASAALKAAAASHPVVAALLKRALEGSAFAAGAKWLHIFGSEK
jgi:hypothetical protein